MANTRQSTKRAKQADQRQARNTLVKSATKSAVRTAVASLSGTSKDTKATKEAYINAVKALAKAASKGAIPKQRAARKISRLTLLAQKTQPQVLGK